MAEDCPFCEGRAAAERGEPDTANPYLIPDDDPSSPDYRYSDYWLWDVGYGVGSTDWSTVKAVRRKGAKRQRDSGGEQS